MDPKLKKNIYLGLWLILGALLGTFIGELVELILLNTNHSELLENNLIIYVLLIFTGLIFAVWAGPVAWKKIYIDGARGKKYVIKK